MYLAQGATDMRKSINFLSLLVEEQFGLDLFTGNLFAFCNRRRDMVKILYWSGSSFCIWLKRLDQLIIQLPEDPAFPRRIISHCKSLMLSILFVCRKKEGM